MVWESCWVECLENLPAGDWCHWRDQFLTCPILIEILRNSKLSVQLSSSPFSSWPHIGFPISFSPYFQGGLDTSLRLGFCWKEAHSLFRFSSIISYSFFAHSVLYCHEDVYSSSLWSLGFILSFWALLYGEQTFLAQFNFQPGINMYSS